MKLLKIYVIRDFPSWQDILEAQTSFKGSLKGLSFRKGSLKDILNSSLQVGFH